MKKNREPLDSASRTGYMIDNLFKHIRSYEYTAYEILHCIDEAVEENNNIYNDSGEGRFVYQSEVAEAKRLILDAEASQYKYKEAHELLRQIHLSAGYREITTFDFLQHGAGGTRD